MSSSNKSVSSGGKGTNKNKSSQQHGKSDHHQTKSSDSMKHEKAQPNTVQTWHAQIIDTRMGSGEDPNLKECIKQVMDMTRRSEDEVVMALHDSDGDLDRAVNDLLEGVKTEWEVKKKKLRQPGGSKQNMDVSGGQDEGGDWDERRNQRGGGPPRMRGRANHDNRGWRGRENKENERNMEDGVRDGSYSGNRRGRGGPGRPGRGGRGGGRGLGPRTFASRNDPSSTSSPHNFNRSIDTWTGNDEQQQAVQEPKMEDWDNEEYTGSLADTKVFTPSTSVVEPTPSIEEPKSQDLPSVQTNQNVNLALIQQEELPKLSEIPQIQQQSLIQQSQQQQPVLNLPTMQLSQQPNAMTGGVLTAAQTQYLTQLTQQTSENLKAAGQTAFSSSISNQPQRQTKQRPRVPPPSKIPSSAVEMPGDAVNSGIGFLDVQFGALEFGSDSGSLDGAANEKLNSASNAITNVDVTSTTNTVNTANTNNSLDIETTQTSTTPFNTTSQMLSNSDNLPVSSEHSINAQSFTTRGSSTGQTLDITKQDYTSQVSPGNAPSYGTTTAYQSQKSTFQTPNATPSTYNAYSTNAQSAQSSFQTASGTSANSYSTTATVSQASYNSSSSFPQSNTSTFSQASPSTPASATSGYNQPTTTNQVYQSATGYVPTTTSQYQAQSVATNTLSNSSTGYQTSGYQGSSSFQSTPQAYQPSATTFTSPITQTSGTYQSAAQSVYASAYGTYASQPQTASHNHKLNSNTTKDSQYDSNTTTSNSSLATTTAPTLGLSSASVNSSQTKVTNSNAVPKSTSSGVVTGSSGSGNMTGGGAAGSMTPMLGHQYIMGQGVPYAFQQPMYSYEELQLMQQRIPHMPTTGYYDAALGYQTTGPATSLGGGRGDALSGVQGVQGVQSVQGPYTSINDARFARNDSNASPVPSTMSQQTATQHQQPMMNPTLPPTYAYFAYGSGIMPGAFPYGTPAAIYPQIAAAGNAGTNSGAYSTKPGSYGSGYGAGASYDALASAGPSAEYKGAGSSYTSTQTGKTGTSTGNTNTGGSSATDISATMYPKSHVALSKVNSYDKQTFHSATPPPFSLTGNQNAGLPGAYGTPHLFIPTMPHQLHQPLHQDGGSSTGQRSNTSSQNKAQAKPGYSPSYWTGSN
ncbi:PREDICTED: protein lingerer isoform X2 [Dufourea novaeangliae]|uniref:protein lingerer isoform X2 n=1 Tax=Dufourea novaeangliae TaxID=178035 RepID=UPI0007672C2D|nr:PREDICTED: protein lingerer isoform X2 [Dufourea novaeangliae]